MNNSINTNINLIDKNSSAEGDILKNIKKNEFYTIIKQEKIDLKKVIMKRKSFNEDFHRFNCVIKKLYQTKKLSIIEIAVYLYTDLFTYKEVFECFNEENMYELRRCFAKKYDITLDTNILKFFMF